jgi:hypothetical protein
VSKEKNFWDAEARRRERAFKERIFHLTNTIPGSAVVLASGGLFVTNAYEAVTTLDSSKILPTASYYGFCLGAAAIMKMMKDEHDS